MSSSAALAGIAASSAASANAAAARARDAECRMLVRGFDNATATVQEKREYASCINTLHPDEMSPGVVIGLKILFAIALLGMAAGIFYSRREHWSGWAEHCLMGIVGFLVAPIAVLFASGLVLGMWWLVT